MNNSLRIENIPQEIVDRIYQISGQNNCSISQTVISLLQRSIEQNNDLTKSKHQSNLIKTIKESSNRREQLSKNIQWLDSTELIREDRQR